MVKYIIMYQSYIGAFKKPIYHEGIDAVRRSKLYDNSYAEVITFVKRKAKYFYSRDEAIKVSNLFKSKNHIPSIIDITL